jgi:hypothetical protein
VTAAPKQLLLGEARTALEYLTRADGQFLRFHDPYQECFNRSAETQVIGFLKRLVDTNIGEGISEAEAELLGKLVDASYGAMLRNNMGEDQPSLRGKENPFYKLLSSLRQYSLVKRDAIHIEIHQPQLASDKPMQIDPAILDPVYDALHDRIEKIAAHGTQGGLFLKGVFAPTSSSATPQGKLEAILRVIDLGSAEDIGLRIFTNQRYHDALKDAVENGREPSLVRKGAIATNDAAIDVEQGALPRRGFFRALSEAFIGAAITPIVAPAAISAVDRVGAGRNDRISSAMKAIKAGNQSGKIGDDELRKILEDVSSDTLSEEMAKGGAAGLMAHYIMQKQGDPDRLGQFLSSLADECNGLSYPVVRFGTPSSERGAAAAR